MASAGGPHDTAAEAGSDVMAHGYTHRTTRTGDVVTKAYQGPDAEVCCAREAAALMALAGLLPVPRVIAAGRAQLRTALAPGLHGQDLIEAGLARPVLAACGRMLRQIHELPIPPVMSGGSSRLGGVLVHGDFGPNNVLLDARARDVTAVLDWEWMHVGAPVEDLAWCEFIVRMHHPSDQPALDAFYSSYGSRPAWADLHQAITRRCEWMLELCERWQPDGVGVARWGERLTSVRSWTQSS
jgi:aminoglycoside phosphotransferase